jgi:hypothetical protein
VENRAATRQTGIGARQQVDPDTLLESVVGPQPFHNHHPRLQSIKAAGVNDDTAAPVPDAQPVAIAEPSSVSGPEVLIRRRIETAIRRPCARFASSSGKSSSMRRRSPLSCVAALYWAGMSRHAHLTSQATALSS